MKRHFNGEGNLSSRNPTSSEDSGHILKLSTRSRKG